MVDPQQFWSRDDGISTGSGLSREKIRDCGSRFGVRFPDAYVELFSVQNGGRVRDEDLELFPLPGTTAPGEFGVVATVEHIAGEDEFARELIEDELGDPRHVLLIAGDDGHTYHALDFNANGPFGEPRVVWLDFECSDWAEVSPTFAEFVDDLLRSDDECAIDLREIQRLTVIAHGTVDYGIHRGPRVEQHLCDSGESLILFEESNGPDGHELSRVEITKPLHADSCVISAMGPKPDQTFALMLRPDDSDSIVSTSSRQTGDGRWKNDTSRGVPLYVQFASTDKLRLIELRTQLLGGELSERAAADEQWQERMDELSEEEMEAAFPHMMLQMMGEMENLFGDLDPDDAPAELKPAMQHMRQLKAKMKADLEQRAAGTAPPNPELLDLMEQMMPRPEDFNFDD